MKRPTRAADGTTWWSAARLSSFRCALRGHSWTAQPTAAGYVLVFCTRCSELVTADFVDVQDVMGLPPVEGDSWLGVASSARVAVDLAAALVDLNESDRVRLRKAATGRPGAAVDCLAQLAAVLSRMVDPAHPLVALQQVALRVEMSALEHLLAAPPAANQ